MNSSSTKCVLIGVEFLYSIPYHYCVCMCAQSCLTLCDPMDCSPPGFFAHGIFQVRILEWIAISYFRGSSQPRDQTGISCISSLAGGFFTVHTTLPPILVLIQLAVTKASSHVSWSMATRLCPIGAWSTMGHRVPCTIQHSYNAFPASQSPGEFPFQVICTI